MQYLLCKHLCRLVICYQGGISSYNQLLDTQFLLINSIPININILINPINRLILKKIYFVKAKKYLNCNQIIKDKLHLNLSKSTLKSKSVKLEENSELEIFNALKETFKVNLNSTKLQKIYLFITKFFIFFLFTKFSV